MATLLKKLIFVVENNPTQIKDIKEHFIDHKHFEFRFFETSAACLPQIHQHPLAVFIDYDLKEINNEEKDAVFILDEIKRLEHDTEVVFFSAHDNQEVAKDTIKHGAHDYILLNDYRFLRMENNLLNIEEHFTAQRENRKFRRIAIATIAIVGIWIVVVIILVALGVFKPGHSMY